MWLYFEDTELGWHISMSFIQLQASLLVVFTSVRIRIFGSVHWITDPDSALFVNGFQEKK
jgi:hypothetical protein